VTKAYYPQLGFMQYCLYICSNGRQVWQGIAGTHEPPAIADRDGWQEGQARTAVRENREEIESAPN
jgi:hypothetical protein